MDSDITDLVTWWHKKGVQLASIQAVRREDEVAKNTTPNQGVVAIGGSRNWQPTQLTNTKIFNPLPFCVRDLLFSG